MSQTYLGVVVALLATLLPRLGVVVGTEELTATVSVVLQVVASLWALYGRYRVGGVSALGFKK